MVECIQLGRCIERYLFSAALLCDLIGVRLVDLCSRCPQPIDWTDRTLQANSEYRDPRQHSASAVA